MAAKKFIRLVAGALTEIAGVVTSAGAGNDGDIPALDATGRLDTSVMPVGIGADTAAITASEALAAGDFVNIWDSTGFKVRKADATVAGKEAHGFVLAAVASAATATVYLEGPNTQVTAQTAGKVYLQTTAGIGGSTVPSASGNVVQIIGVATSATVTNFSYTPPVTLA